MTNPKNIPWEVSSGVRFNYNLAPVDISLPDSKTKNIIYLPKGMELPIEEKVDSRYKFPFRKKTLSKTSTANVSIKQGTLGFSVEFRHADVNEPTPSLKLLRTLNRPTSSPASISWNGYELVVSDDSVERKPSIIAGERYAPQMTEEALPISDSTEEEAEEDEEKYDPDSGLAPPY
jgi:hypothetical protein